MKKIFLLSYILIYCMLCPGNAEIVLDGSIGSMDQGTQIDGPNYDIKSDYGQMSGSNLFHSFETFNIYQNESANFSGPSSVQNIISRVTGGDYSFIDGNISSSINGANLYFLNPAGVIFGENASLDLTGSFFVGTGDSLLMGNEKFYAAIGENEGLSANNPTGFSFSIDSSFAPIILQGTDLTVEDNQIISLIGGGNELTDLPDNISVDNPGVSLSDSTLHTPNGQVEIASILSEGDYLFESDIMTSNQIIKYGNVSMTNSEINVDGGKVLIQGGQFFMQDESSIIAGAQPEVGGAIKIIFKGKIDISDSQIRLNGKISSGSVLLKASNISLSDSTINTGTLESGKGGDINIIANNGLSFSNGCLIETKPLENSIGTAGNIVMEASDITYYDKNVLNAEQISIKADILKFKDASLNAELYNSQDNGKLSINVSQMEMNGSDFIVDDQNYSILANKTSLDIYARDSIKIQNDSTIKTTNSQSSTGSIILKALNNFQVSDSLISTQAEHSGNAGHINMSGKYMVLNESSINANADKGTGGKISIVTDILIRSYNTNFNVESGFGKDGSVNINNTYKDIYLGIKPIVLNNKVDVSFPKKDNSSFSLQRYAALPAPHHNSWFESSTSKSTGRKKSKATKSKAINTRFLGTDSLDSQCYFSQ